MADVTFKFTAEDARAHAAFQKLIDKQRELGQGAEEVGRKTKSAAKENEEAWGDKAVSSITGYIGKLSAAKLGLDAVLAVQKAVNEARQAGARSLESSEFAMSQLAQLSGGDRKKFAASVAAARKTFGEGGAKSLEEAAKAQFALESAGFSDEKTRAFSSRMFGVVEDPGKAAAAIATIRATMGNRAGGFESILAKGITASKIAPGGIEDVLKAAAKGGGLASAMGISPDQLLAGTAITSQAAGSPEEGGTQMAALLEALARHGMKGDLGAAVEKIASRHKTPKSLIKFLGSDRATRGFLALRENLPQFRGLTGEIAGASPELAESMLGLPATDPDVAAARGARVEAAKAEVGKADMGRHDLLRKAQRDKLTSAVRADWGKVADQTSWLPRGLGEVGALGMGALYDVFGSTPKPEKAPSGDVKKYDSWMDMQLDVMRQIEQNTRGAATKLVDQGGPGGPTKGDR